MTHDRGFYFPGNTRAFDGLRHGIQGGKSDVRHPYQVIPVFIYTEIDQLFLVLSCCTSLFKQCREITRIIFDHIFNFTGRSRRRDVCVETNNTIQEICSRIFFFQELNAASQKRPGRYQSVQADVLTVYYGLDQPLIDGLVHLLPVCLNEGLGIAS